jgi:hypothetical protein
MVAGGSFPEVAQPEYEPDHSSPSSVENKMSGAVPPFHHTSSWCNAQLIKTGMLPLPVWLKIGIARQRLAKAFLIEFLIKSVHRFKG